MQAKTEEDPCVMLHQCLGSAIPPSSSILYSTHTSLMTHTGMLEFNKHHTLETHKYNNDFNQQSTDLSGGLQWTRVSAEEGVNSYILMRQQ